MTPVGEMISERLAELSLVPAQGAERVGMTRQMLHKILTGAKPVSAKLALKIEAGLGIPAENLMIAQVRAHLEEAFKENAREKAQSK